MAKMKHFFPHDASASRDGKIIEMKMEFGARGYGVYWEILEYLFEQGGTAKYNPRLIAIAIHEDVRFVKRFLASCIDEHKLFETDGTYFWSRRLRREIDRIEDISTKNSSNALKKSASKNSKLLLDKEINDNELKNNGCDRKATAERSLNDRSAIDKTRRDDTRENIQEEKNIKKGVYGEFQNVLLDSAELSKLLDQLGGSKATEWIERLSSYKASTGKKYKSDFATIRNWVRKETIEAEHSHTQSSISNTGRVLTFKPKLVKTILDEMEAQA